MKKFLMFTAISSFITIAAIASVDGKWEGTGSVEMTGMPAMSCERVSLDLADGASKLEIRQFTTACSGMNSEMSQIALDLRDGAYYLGDQRVGQRTGDVVDVTLADPSGATMQIRLERNGNELAVKNSMTANGFSQVVTATLHQ